MELLEEQMDSKNRGNEVTETAMAKAWRQASEDLQFEFISPYTFVDKVGNQHTCSGLIVHFGSPMGTIIVSQHDEDPDADIVGDQLGYYTSALNPLYYETYDRDIFMAALRDWGWHGPPEKRPPWAVPQQP